MDLHEFCDLVYGSTEPVQLSACWLALVGEQHWFRWKQGSVQARSLEELKPLRRARRRQAIAEAAERQWHRLLKQREPIETSTCSALQLERLELLKQVASGRLELEQLPDGMRQSLSQLHLGQERSQVRHLLVDLAMGFTAGLARRNRGAGSQELLKPNASSRRQAKSSRAMPAASISPASVA